MRNTIQQSYVHVFACITRFNIPSTVACVCVHNLELCEVSCVFDLRVLGAVAFVSGDEEVRVSDMGTVLFSFAIEFSRAGPLENREEVNKFELLDLGGSRVVECQTVEQTDSSTLIDCPYMNINDHQWWTVAGNSIENVLFILHQAQSTDRGPYTARIEGVDPASNSVDKIEKTISVFGNLL